MNKLIFLFKKPKAVLISGNGRETAKEAIFKVYSRHFKVGKEIIIGKDTHDMIAKICRAMRMNILYLAIGNGLNRLLCVSCCFSDS